MRNVVFVAPFLMRATLQFVAGAAGLKGARLYLISQDREEKIPRELREQIAGYWHLENALDEDAISEAVAEMSRRVGPISRLIGTLEQLQIPLARVRQKLSIDGLGVEASINFREKSVMKNVLRQHKVPCARHCLADSQEPAIEFCRQVGFPVVVKPPAGAGSRDTFQVDDFGGLATAFQKLRLSAQAPLLLEEFIMGNEHTFESAFVNGEMVWHSITRYFPTPLQVLENPWIQWCILLPREIDHPHFDDIRATARQSVRALGMQTGFTHLEWFRRMDGSIAVSEVAARPPGGQLTSMHGFAHDFDIHAAWAELMIFDRFQPPERHFATGAVFLRGQGQGRVKAIHGLDRIQKELGPMIVESKLPRLQQPASSTYEGEGYVIIKHPQTSVVEKALGRMLTTIRVELG